MERREGKGRRTKPTCVYPSFSDISIEKKLQPPTNKPTPNRHHRPTFRSLPSPTLLVLLFPCLRVCSFTVGDPGCVLFSLPKRLPKKDWRTPNVYFRVSNFEKHKHFQQKIHGEFWALTFRPAPFLRCYFFCDTIVVFSIQCLWELFFLKKKK